MQFCCPVENQRSFCMVWLQNPFDDCGVLKTGQQESMLTAVVPQVSYMTQSPVPGVLVCPCVLSDQVRVHGASLEATPEVPGSVMKKMIGSFELVVLVDIRILATQLWSSVLVLQGSKARNMRVQDPQNPTSKILRGNGPRDLLKLPELVSDIFPSSPYTC